MEVMTACARKANRAALLGLIGCTVLVLQPEHNQLFAQSTPPAAEAPKILERCFQCHGEGVQMGDLDLHNRAAMMKGGSSGAVVVPGNADGSILYQRVAGKVAPIMPMKPVAPLNAKELEIIKSWINDGAKWESGNAAPTAAAATASPYGSYKERTFTEADRNWWAFKPPVRYPVPAVKDARWTRNPIDGFIKAQLDKKGLEAAPEADRRTLIRRVYLDLVGLLPTPDEVEAFVKDPAPNAYDKLVDKLLESPHYGERWGRFWLDVVRYADSSGFEFDVDVTNAWRYRDYVIKAFNTDKPYNQLIKEQLAGDELDHPTEDSLIATTYYRVGPRVRFREKNYPSYRYDYMDDMVRTTFQGFMGLSVNCSRCHDHKFDPISRLDYYKSVAMFWPYVDYDHPLAPKAEVDAYNKVKDELDREMTPLQQEIARIEKPYRDKQREKQVQEALKKFPEDIQAAIKTPEDKRTPGQKLLVAQVLINPEAANPDDIVADASAGRRAKQLAKANQVFGVANYSKKGDIKLSDADEARRNELRAQIAKIEEKLPDPLPVADGVRDGDYRSTPDGMGDLNIPGNGRITYANAGPFLPKPSEKYEPPPLHFAANGGDIKSDDEGFLIQPGFLTVFNQVKGLGELPVTDPPKNGAYPTSGRRRALAEWIASDNNPLTARVMINRVWGWHFGTGIVSTPGNYGKMGAAPTNPELLDWLSTEFVRQGWSIKQMQRLIMTSETYKMASAFYRPANAEKDPTNTFLSSFPIHRVEAEIVRDEILSASGKINLQAGGEPFYPPIPVSVRANQPRGNWDLTQEGPDTWKRSVYAFRKRGIKYPMFEVLDEPDLNVTCERRSVSTVPTQSLTLLNNEFILKQVDYFAERVAKEAGDDPAADVKAMYRIALSRDPNQRELATNIAFLQKQREAEAVRAAFEGKSANLLALSGLAHVVLNLNEFEYIR